MENWLPISLMEGNSRITIPEPELPEQESVRIANSRLIEAYRRRTMNRRDFLFQSAGLSSIAAAQNTARRQPNILFFLADDLGYQDLGCFGSQTIRTPNIDSIASKGIRFTDFYVSWPACTPSRSSILTGRYPQRNGLYDMIRNNEVNWKFQFDEESYAVSPEMTLGMDTREVTIGQALQRAGYKTAVIGKWDGGRAKRFLPTRRGFDFFYGFANTGIDYYTHERYGVPSMFRNTERIKEEGHATDLFLREATKFISDNRQNPFFLYLPFNAPHSASTFDRTTRQAPEKYLAVYPGLQGRKREYAALVTHMDDAVGEILKQLKQYGLEDNTLVVFMSDNGGENSGSNSPLRGRKAQLFEGGLRVPFIARWPGRIPENKVNREFASSLELFPTFVAAAGSKPDPQIVLDGFNLLPTLEGRAASPRKEMFWQRKGDRAARVGEWKWVDSAEGGGLFHLEQDISEKNDRSAQDPSAAGIVKSQWAQWRRQMDNSEPRGPFRDY
jgi:arylsulfatase A-like enzyme